MRKITLYRDDSTTQVVYEHVKHWFFTAGNTMLTLAQFTRPGESTEHRYIHWPRERFCWFKDEPEPEPDTLLNPITWKSVVPVTQ
jgi:hypothetical protein